VSLANADTNAGGDQAMQISCRKVLRTPARYEAGLLKLCRKLSD
jgi:hypothetical protein